MTGLTLLGVECYNFPLVSGGGGPSTFIRQNVLNAAPYTVSTGVNFTTAINNVSSGATIGIFVTYGKSTLSNVTSVTDGTAYTSTAVVNSLTDLQGTQYWYRDNVVASSYVITVINSVAADFRGARVFEAVGVSTTSLDVTTGQNQQTPGTGADGLTSGNVTTTANGDLIVGWALEIGETAAPSVGTSPNAFSLVASSSALDDLLEVFTQTNAGIIAATAQAGANESCNTLIVALRHI